MWVFFGVHFGMVGGFSLRRLIFGDPLPTSRIKHERLGVLLGVPVFASDAISSCAYATDEILIGLSVAGVAALTLSVPVAMAIVVVLVLVTLSYQQIIRAYPEGGGAYTVAKENIGRRAGLVAGAALLIDYILTVAVSMTSGVENLASAVPALVPYRMWLSVLGIVLLTWLNLRGVRESARVVAVPVYVFIATAGTMILLGLGRVISGDYQPYPLPDLQPTHHLGAWVVLHSFASGCVALTGIEAVSNGVQAFREPHVRNARIVMAILACLLACFFFGMSTLSRAFHVMPAPGTQTVMSLLGRKVFGETWAYYLLQFSTLTILILAANTSFQGFPRVARLIAQDGFLPRQLANLGDRLVFANGIALLGAIAVALVIIFRGSTHALIPLYSVGVFLSFTLSQVGLLRRWLRERPPGWFWSVLACAPGALATGLVMCVVAAAKFVYGAWMVVLAIPGFVRMFLRVRQHYDAVARQLTLEGFERPKQRPTNVVVVPVASLHRGTVFAMEYAKSLGKNIRAVHVVTNEEQFEALKRRWQQWEPDIPLIGLPSPYRSLVRPVIEYVIAMRTQFDTVTVLIPEFVVGRWWEQLLHNQSAILLDWSLRHLKGVQVLHFRYQLEP